MIHSIVYDKLDLYRIFYFIQILKVVSILDSQRSKEINDFTMMLILF